MVNSVRVGFLGAGLIAQSHAYALDVLNYYYADIPKIEKIVVASPTPASRETFARRFKFNEAISPEAMWDRNDIDTLFILGPNHTHTSQLLQAVDHSAIQRIYVEKPLGASQQDLRELETLGQLKINKPIMIGFQFLQKSALRKALAHWQSGVLGEPIHFRFEYLHSSYLDPQYRQNRADRLAPIPLNGAIVDLGSHALSLLVAFLGENLTVKAAAASGLFEDVPDNTDLCTTVLLKDVWSGAVGTVLASRVSQGTGDHMQVEIRATRGALIYNSDQPDVYKTFTPQQSWQLHEVMSDYQPSSKFPSDYTPSGWLRALVHNHYLFFGGDPEQSFIPDLQHGIQVQ